MPLVARPYPDAPCSAQGTTHDYYRNLLARALIKEHGLTATDIFPAPGKKPKGSVGQPKYRDRATGATWTGRGKPPLWIKDAADRTPFEITPAA
ncbi:H-NS histone family protein [Delftia acidovorans]|uniref:H-NS histone family protein n=1 Tax=Delftia acidovorans TaxID=80866 RepID=UPI0032DFE8B8